MFLPFTLLLMFVRFIDSSTKTLKRYDDGEQPRARASFYSSMCSFVVVYVYLVHINKGVESNARPSSRPWPFFISVNSVFSSLPRRKRFSESTAVARVVRFVATKHSSQRRFQCQNKSRDHENRVRWADRNNHHDC